MAGKALTAGERKGVEKAVTRFLSDRWQFELAAKNVVELLSKSPGLAPYIHFLKWRVKDPDHLREKLYRKALERKMAVRSGRKRPPIAIDENNLFNKVTDLAGVRLIYLHTDQFSRIHSQILDLLTLGQYRLVEKPTASCWDSEYESVYKALGIRTRQTEGYSSVHYVFEINRRTGITCELQVRTITDEVWGEVSHKVNYQQNSPSTLCQKQLRTLARLTTGCTRLVDSIFELDASSRLES
jgi:putative GTP pyrophosphokinase